MDEGCAADGIFFFGEKIGVLAMADGVDAFFQRMDAERTPFQNRRWFG